MAKIRLQDVRKEFASYETFFLPGLKENTPQDVKGPTVALDGVNLLIRNGETVAVLGPSGCGKTTLLRAIAGLTVYEGHVYYDDRLMDDVKPDERNLGMVFQNYALYPHFRGIGNLSFTFFVRRRPDEEAQERIRITSEIMGIGFDELLKHRPGQLSGGEQQRVALGRALVRNPDLILFDEPLSNLDAKLRTRTRAEIKRLMQQFRHTAVYVTHDQMEATAIGDRLAIMRAGRVEQIGDYRTLYDRPLNTFVAGFLGNPPMNLLPGALNERGNWQGGDLEMPVSKTVSDRTQVGWPLTVGIRPEHARLAADEPATLTGIVVHIERDLSRRAQTLLVEQEVATDIAVTVSSDTWIRLGDRVPVVLPTEKFICFDGETGRRIG
jgi:ABC-type sugar transport system ATPase subunit